MYDTVGQRIQLDPTTLCKFNSTKGYYFSSDVSSCKSDCLVRITKHQKRDKKRTNVNQKLSKQNKQEVFVRNCVNCKCR